MAFTFTIEHSEDDMVEIGFGTFGRLSSSGAIGERKENNESKTAVKKEQTNQNERVEIPKAVNVDESNTAAAEKLKKEEKNPPEEVKPLVSENKNADDGRELSGDGSGKFGFDIDFGGKGIRKIYSYNIPKYPEGVSKEIDVKLRFTILADGTVGRIFPLIKADARLETAAINSLRQWRFEPLPSAQKQAEQTAMIIFPFRLE